MLCNAFIVCKTQYLAHSIAKKLFCITSYRPLNFTPEYLKERTDAAMSLLNEIQEMEIDEPKLKPRETKTIYLVSSERSPLYIYIMPLYVMSKSKDKENLMFIADFLFSTKI